MWNSIIRREQILQDLTTKVSLVLKITLLSLFQQGIQAPSLTASHMHKWLGQGRKKKTTTWNNLVCAPLCSHSQVYSKGNLILVVTNGQVTKAEHFHKTPPSPQARQKVAHHLSASLAHKHQGTPWFYPCTAWGVKDNNDLLLEWLTFRMRGFYSSLGQTLILFNPWTTQRMA